MVVVVVGRCRRRLLLLLLLLIWYFLFSACLLFGYHRPAGRHSNQHTVCKQKLMSREVESSQVKQPASEPTSGVGNCAGCCVCLPVVGCRSSASSSSLSAALTAAASAAASLASPEPPLAALKLQARDAPTSYLLAIVVVVINMPLMISFKSNVTSNVNSSSSRLLSEIIIAFDKSAGFACAVSRRRCRGLWFRFGWLLLRLHVGFISAECCSLRVAWLRVAACAALEPKAARDQTARLLILCVPSLCLPLAGPRRAAPLVGWFAGFSSCACFMPAERCTLYAAYGVWCSVFAPKQSHSRRCSYLGGLRLEW